MTLIGQTEPGLVPLQYPISPHLIFLPIFVCLSLICPTLPCSYISPHPSYFISSIRRSSQLPFVWSTPPLYLFSSPSTHLYSDHPLSHHPLIFLSFNCHTTHYNTTVILHTLPSPTTIVVCYSSDPLWWNSVVHPPLCTTWVFDSTWKKHCYYVRIRLLSGFLINHNFNTVIHGH